MAGTLIRKSCKLFAQPGFDQLRGADLVFAVIAHVENATLVTLDQQFQKNLGGVVKVLDLGDSRDKQHTRNWFRLGGTSGDGAGR